MISDALIAHIGPIAKHIAELEKDQAYIAKLLKEGSEKARAIATININEIKKIMGLDKF